MAAPLPNAQRGPLPYPNTGRILPIRNYNAAVSAPVATSNPATQIASENPVRSSIVVQNVGSVDVYLGPDANVSASASSASRGVLLKGGQTPPAVYSDATMSGPLFAIAAGAGADLCVMETSAP